MNSTEVRRYWAERAGEYSPEYYAHHGPNYTSRVVFRLLERFIDRDAPVLEIGCSAGRHLAFLHRRGFENLVGIEVNPDAEAVMESTYPDLADAGTFYFEAVEDVIGDFDDDQFGAIYSVEALQHLHPDAMWVFDEFSRVTRDLLVTVENEGDDDRPDSDEPAVTYVNDDFPLYFRDWGQVFEECGFVELESESVGRDTARVFRPINHRTD